MNYKYEDSDPRVRAAYFVALHQTPPQHDIACFNVLLEVMWGTDDQSFILYAISDKLKGNMQVEVLSEEELSAAVMDGK